MTSRGAVYTSRDGWTDGHLPTRLMRSENGNLAADSSDSSCVLVANVQNDRSQSSNNPATAHVNTTASHRDSIDNNLEDSDKTGTHESPTDCKGEELKCHTHVGDPIVKSETSSGESSGVEIIVDSSAVYKPSNGRKPSCWVQKDDEVGNSGITWDDSGQDIERYVSPKPTINNLSKRRPQISAQSPVEFRSGACITPKELLRTTANFPPLSLPLQASNSTQGSKAVIGNPSCSTLPPKEMSRAIPSHLGRKKKDDNASKIAQEKPSNEKDSAYSSLPQRSNIERASSKVKLDHTLPPDIAAAWDKASLKKPEGDENREITNVSFTITDAEVSDTIVQPLVSQKAATSAEPQGRNPSCDVYKDRLDHDEKSIEKLPEPAPSEYISMASSAFDEWAKSYTQRNPPPKAKSNTQSKEDTSPERTEQNTEPVVPEKAAGQEQSSLAINKKSGSENASTECNASHGSSNSTDPEKLALTEYVSSDEKADHPSSTSIEKGKNTKSEDSSQGYLWMATGKERGLVGGKERVPAAEKEHSLAGWDNKFKPAPLGDEWAMRAPHNTRDPKHKASIQLWANDQSKIRRKAVSLRLAGFRTGNSFVERGKILDNKISIQHTVPDYGSLNVPNRWRTAEEAVKDYVERYGATGPKESSKRLEEPSKPEWRDPVSGLTKRERMEKLKFFINAFKDCDYQNEHAPKANIYMRPAEEKDMRLITHLHNGYIQTSTTSHYTKQQTEDSWRSTFRKCLEDKCPFFVAIMSKSQTKVTRAQDVKAEKNESVVGFAYATDFGEPDNAFRITLDVEIWVDVRYPHQGIGKTLLDRMLACLDPMYSWKDPAPFVHNDDPAKWMAGGHRIIQTIMVVLLYAEDDKASMEWKRDWLVRNNFKVSGYIPAVCRKMRKQVNMCQLYYTTGHDTSYFLP